LFHFVFLLGRTSSGFFFLPSGLEKKVSALRRHSAGLGGFGGREKFPAPQGTEEGNGF